VASNTVAINNPTEVLLPTTSVDPVKYSSRAAQPTIANNAQCGRVHLGCSEVSDVWFMFGPVEGQCYNS
jgi:hypothetical protein